jgi:hypothetical protein
MEVLYDQPGKFAPDPVVTTNCKLNPSLNIGVPFLIGKCVVCQHSRRARAIGWGKRGNSGKAEGDTTNSGSGDDSIMMAGWARSHTYGDLYETTICDLDIVKHGEVVKTIVLVDQ